MLCASCLVSLPAGARFCLQCGAPAPREDSAAEVRDPLREVLGIALGRQYEVLRLLGRGGMGAVYLARETALDREVAIKVLPAERGATPEGRERFRREARTAARLSHPNIVPLHTFGDVDGTMYFVMGYVRGESLADRIRRQGRLSADEATRILIEVAEALDYAHKLGIVHRDIKPDNVLIEEETGRAMLTDFGVAKALGSGQTMTVEGSLLGTPHYMSPEQAQGSSDIDHRSDLYSLGVMGYLMLSGRLPFEGRTTADVLVQHITKEAPPLQTLAPDVPAEISAALIRCLAKDPLSRWPDARSLRAALSPADDDVPAPLESLQGLAMVSLVCLVLLLYFGVWALGGGDIAPFQVVMSFSFGFGALLFALLVIERSWSAKKSGFDVRRIRYEILKQPRWWTGWYPERFRSRRDVWPRLPAQLRRARNGMSLWLTASALFLVPAILAREAFEAHVARSGSSPYPIGVNHAIVFVLLVICVLLFVVALVAMSRWEKHARSLGLQEPHLRAHMTGVPAGRHSFWSRPEIAAVLLPAVDQAGRPRTAREFAEAVSGAVNAMPESARALCVPAVLCARRLVMSLEPLDREIAALEGTLKALDGTRLAEKLAALEVLQTHSNEHGEVREALQKQLELLRALDARLRSVNEEKALRGEILKNLWLQVTSLRSAAGIARSQTSERILAICAQIEARLSAETIGTPVSLTPTGFREAPTLDV